MSIDKMIQALTEMKEKYGPDVEVFMQKGSVSGGTIIQGPVTVVKPTITGERIVLF